MVAVACVCSGGRARGVSRGPSPVLSAPLWAALWVRAEPPSAARGLQPRSRNGTQSPRTPPALNSSVKASYPREKAGRERSWGWAWGYGAVWGDTECGSHSLAAEGPKGRLAALLLRATLGSWRQGVTTPASESSVKWVVSSGMELVTYKV